MLAATQLSIVNYFSPPIQKLMLVQPPFDAVRTEVRCCTNVGSMLYECRFDAVQYRV